MQTRSRYLHTCCIKSPARAAGWVGKEMIEWQGTFKCTVLEATGSINCLEANSDSCFIYLFLNPVGSKNMVLNYTAQDH